MPKSFDACRKGGGKIRTIQVGKEGKYMHVCILNGKTYKGEVKTKASGDGEKSPVAEAIKQQMK